MLYLAESVLLHFLVEWDSLRNHNQNSSEILQEYLAILTAFKLGDEKQELPEHKLVNAKDKGGLRIFFCIAEQIFKKHIETCSNNMDSKLITKAVLEDTGKLRWQLNHKKFSGRPHSSVLKKMDIFTS